MVALVVGVGFSSSSHAVTRAYFKPSLNLGVSPGLLTVAVGFPFIDETTAEVAIGGLDSRSRALGGGNVGVFIRHSFGAIGLSLGATHYQGDGKQVFGYSRDLESFSESVPEAERKRLGANDFCEQQQCSGEDVLVMRNSSWAISYMHVALEFGGGDGWAGGFGFSRVFFFNVENSHIEGDEELGGFNGILVSNTGLFGVQEYVHSKDRGIYGFLSYYFSPDS